MDATFTITNTSKDRDLVLTTHGPAYAGYAVAAAGKDEHDPRTETQVIRPGESTAMDIKPHEHSWPITFSAGRERKA